MPVSFKTHYKSPIGLIEITGTVDSLTSLNFVDDHSNSSPTHESNEFLEQCIKQLDEYFVGDRKEFEINLAPEGTEFQKKVWNELLKIPFGETKSYLWQSKMLGNQLAIRAVATANGKNKISIIIPCHRVIGSDGSLTGYAGGLWRKKWLIEHEKKFFNIEKQLDLF